MKARLTATALALAWSGLVVAGCTERPTEPLLTGSPAADVGPQAVYFHADAGMDVSAGVYDSVSLEGSVLDPASRPIAGWQWQILWGPDGGDLTPPDSQNTIFVGHMDGAYIVSLTVCVDDVEQGTVCTSPDTVIVTVVDASPVAVISVEQTTVEVGETVVFDGSRSSDPEGQALIFSWDFGDGWISNNMSPSHAFETPGDYTVTLEVSDGWSSNKTDILITVEQQAGPRDGIVSLISGIESLVSAGQLSADRGDGLSTKLNAAHTSLDNGLTRDACKQLSAFEKQVTSSIRARKLDAATGQALIEEAEAVRVLIACG